MLSGQKLVVEDEYIEFKLGKIGLDLFQLSLADVSTWIDPLKTLIRLADHFQSCRLSQLGQLLEGIFDLPSGMLAFHFYPDQESFFGGWFSR